MGVAFSSREQEDVCVLSPQGVIVIGEEVAQLRDRISDLLAAGRKNILLNLSGVTYIDSTGLGALVAAFSTVRRQGGQLKLACLSHRVKDLLVLTKLLTVFDVYENEEDGIRSCSADR